MKILHISCSPRGQFSESHRLSRKIIEFLRVKEPSAVLTNRVIGGGAIAHIDASYASALGANEPSFAEAFPMGFEDRSEHVRHHRTDFDPVGQWQIRNVLEIRSHQ